MDFDQALKTTLEFEGGYVNDPDDPGGETKYGISKRAYPFLDIAELTYDQARRIYWQDYWTAAKCDLVPEEIRGIFFDMTVQHGKYRATKIIQEAYNSIGVRHIQVDGFMGLVTFSILDEIGADRLRMVRLDYYADLVIRRPETFAKFWGGWRKRAKMV